MLVKLGQRDQRSRVAFNRFRKQIFIKARREAYLRLMPYSWLVISREAISPSSSCFILDVERQQARVALQILLGDLLNVRGGKRHNGLSAKFGQLVRQILKKSLRS